jgi:hypothetical protein
VSDVFRIATDRIDLRWMTSGAAKTVESAAGRLLVVPRRKGLEFREIFRAGVPAPAAADPEQEAGPVLFEQTSYKVVLKGAGGRRVRLDHDDPLVTHDFDASADDARFGVINFKGQIGRSRFRVYCDDELELEFEVEVFPSKLDYATDYYDLLSDTQEIVTGLAVEYLRATHRSGGTKPSTGMPTFVEWLTILRENIDTLQAGIQRITRQPLRTLEREPTRTRVERITRVDPAVRRSLRKSGSRKPKGWLEQMRSQPTLDTPEHRWLKGQLVAIGAGLLALRNIEEKQGQSVRREAVLRDLRSFEARIARMRQAEPIAAAAGPPPAGFASLQLMRLDGYREAYLACTRLAQVLHHDAEALHMSVKDIEVLYEYWCVLATIRAVSRCTGVPIPLADILQVKQRGLAVTLRQGHKRTVLFNETGRRSIAVTYAPRFSGPDYLIDQTPDLVVSVEEDGWPVIQVVLDAKYRLESGESYVKRYGSPGPPSDALNVLHRYRDAIIVEGEERQNAPRYKRVIVEAAALFPYRERAAGEFEASSLWRSLHRIGIGAIPLLPGGERYLEEWLRGLLNRGGWSVADLAIPHQLNEKAWAFQKAASEIVLVGSLRRKEAEQLAWTRGQRLYYTPMKNQPRLFNVRAVALYVRAGGGKPGTVRYWSDVEDIQVLPRHELATPWVSKQSPDEPQIVYRLRDLRDGLNIVNSEGDRMPAYRLSSRLALQRARTLRELALETEPEWRLTEALRAAGLPFTFAPESSKSEEIIRGRATFVVGDTRIRHRGGDRFQFEPPNEASRELRLEELVRLLMPSR